MVQTPHQCVQAILAHQVFHSQWGLPGLAFLGCLVLLVLLWQEWLLAVSNGSNYTSHHLQGASARWACWATQPLLHIWVWWTSIATVNSTMCHLAGGDLIHPSELLKVQQGTDGLAKQHRVDGCDRLVCPTAYMHISESQDWKQETVAT